MGQSWPTGFVPWHKISFVSKGVAGERAVRSARACERRGTVNMQQKVSYSELDQCM